MRRPVTLLFVLLAGLVSGCGSPVEPPAANAAFGLRAVDTQSLPATLSNTAGGRLIELTGATLDFRGFSRGRGTVEGYAELRITDPGAPPRLERHEIPGRFTRRGSAIRVAYATGATETFAIENGGRALRTVASRCAPTAACEDILRTYRYERL